MTNLTKTSKSCLFDPECALCPRLVDYRQSLRRDHPDWHNGPVGPWGDLETSWLLIIGLAPGKTGANRTGRTFCGDEAGRLLIGTLCALGLAHGKNASPGTDPIPDPDSQDIGLIGTSMINAVLCVPPSNLPSAFEQDQCLRHLTASIGQMPRLEVIVTMGDIARKAALKALKAKASALAPGHNQYAKLGPYHLISSYHCSRYNINTKRLTPQQLIEVFERAQKLKAQRP